MNIVNFMIAEIKILLKNKVTLILLFIMPVFMIGLMGFALEPFIGVDNNEFDAINVLYVNEDSGFVGKGFETFIKGNENKILNTISTNKNELNELIKQNKYTVGIIIPKDISENVIKNKNVQIEIISNGKDFYSENIVRSFLDSYVNTFNTFANINTIYEKYGYNYNELGNSNTQINEASSFLVDLSTKNPIEKINSFQFFSFNMLIFFLLTTGTGLGINILTERKNKLYKRICSFPVRASQYLIGKTLSNSIVGFVQSLIIICTTSIIFKVNWGNNYIGIALIVTLVIFISFGISIILSSILNSTKSLTTVLIVIFWFLTFFSGGFTGFPLFKGLEKFTLNKWAFDSLVSLSSGSNIAEIFKSLVLLITTLIIVWVTGLSLYSRRSIHE